MLTILKGPHPSTSSRLGGTVPFRQTGECFWRNPRVQHTSPVRLLRPCSGVYGANCSKTYASILWSAEPRRTPRRTPCCLLSCTQVHSSISCLKKKQKQTQPFLQNSKWLPVKEMNYTVSDISTKKFRCTANWQVMVLAHYCKCEFTKYSS